MGKINKLVKLFFVATTAYSFYRAVSDFLETETGQGVKGKILDYYSNTKDRVTDFVNEKLEDATDAINNLEDKTEEKSDA